MSVSRVWFPNAPSLITNQRSQIAIGYSFYVQPAPPPVPPIDVNLDYYRNYLNDVLTINTAGPTASLPSQPETDLTSYLRRYLNDPTQN